MPLFAPRIPPRLLGALLRIEDPRLSIAEVHRRLRPEARRLGLPRPSYERVRVLLKTFRLLRLRWRDPRPLTTGQVLLEVWLRRRSPLALADHLYGVPLRPLPP
jgi:hypothetical protein